MADEVKPRMDETAPGGAYIKDGVVVDANGKPREGWTVDKDGNAVAPTATPAQGKRGKAQEAAPDPNAGN